MTELKSLVIDEAQFKKVSKRLLKLNMEEPASSLSVMQEYLAKGFGFKNADSAFKFFAAPVDKPVMVKSPTTVGSSTFSSFSKTDLVSVFKYLMKSEPISDVSSAITILKLIIDSVDEILMFPKETRDKFHPGLTTRSIKVLRYFLNYNKFKSLYSGSEILSPELRESFITYYNPVDRIRDRNEHQHNSIVQTLEQALSCLEDIDDYDAVLLDPAWMLLERDVATKNQEVTDKFTLFETIRLSDAVQRSANGYVAWKVETGGNYRNNYLYLMRDIKRSKYFKASWLDSDVTAFLCEEFFKSRCVKITASSFLLAVSKTLNNKSDYLFQLVMPLILHNYEVVSEYSREFEKISNEYIDIGYTKVYNTHADAKAVDALEGPSKVKEQGYYMTARYRGPYQD